MIPVTDKEINSVTPELITVGASEVVLSDTRLGKSRRIFYSIVPVTAGVICTITFGDAPAVALTGLPLGQYQPLIDCAGDTYQPYQGTIKCIASAGGQISIMERFE